MHRFFSLFTFHYYYFTKALLVFFGIAFFASLNSKAQISTDIPDKWMALQDSLDYWGEQMVRNPDYNVRLHSFETIKNNLSEMLRDTVYGGNTFRDIPYISILTSPDTAFRVITWQLYADKDNYRYHGFLQTLGNEKKVFELNPGLRSNLMVEYRELPLEQWKPGLYYNIYPVKTDSTPYYILFAFDAYGYFERSKFMDVLRFDEAGVPYFGAPVFHKYLNESNTSESMETRHRIVLTYSAESSVTLNYSSVHNHIIFNHLTAIQGTHDEQGLIWVPDGTYEGYKLKGSDWYYVRRVFTEVLEEPPIPNPILDKRKDKDLFGNPRPRQ